MSCASFALFAAGIVAAFLVAGCAASASAPKSGTVPACTAYASGGAAASESSGGGTPGSLLGGSSEFAVQIAALVAWLITAASGGYVLGRWWRAGGRLRRQTDTAVPPVVTLGHPGLGLLGLVIWAVFVATGWVPLAWVAVGLLAALAGLGMAILVIGLPSPRSSVGPAMPGNEVPAQAGATAVLVAPPAPARQAARQLVLVIALHGLFAVAILALALTAAVGAG